MKSLVTLIVLSALAGQAAAQAHPRPLPEQGPAPLLHVLFSGPPGVSVTFYQGFAPRREFKVPVSVGLRPGYVYRVKVTGFPDRPFLEFHPTLEVRGTLCLPPSLPAARYPAPVYLSPFDAEKLLDGSFITKVLYLENPEKAFAEAGRKEQPFEVEFPADRDLLEEAREHGRPVAVIRTGNRDMTDLELRQQSVPNTILFPGDRDLGRPRMPPMVPYVCFKYDPIHGAQPCDEECLRDGGDTGEPATLLNDGRLVGLDPEDTIAEYRDYLGNKKLTVSNRVCLCVPRFAVLRSILHLDQERVALGPGAVRRAEGQVILEGVHGIDRFEGVDHPAEASSRQSASQLVAGMTTSVVGRIDGVKETSVRLAIDTLSALCKTDTSVFSIGKEGCCVPDRPLCLTKWCDRTSAEMGDIVTFTLKYSNGGGRPISDIAVSDSLTGRLEYVPGSSQTSRNAVFTMQPNDSGSLVLRWQFNGILQPGDSGMVRFQAKVR